ncbi:hypothetical protein IKQ21_08160 [bacterium]|nr:hypothetical protein [bacterium]
MVNVAAIFSTLGNPNSLIPLAIKDTASSTGMTVGSFITGKEEGQDRFIDEVGTEALWLLGIPGFKWLFDKTIYKAAKIDSKFDVRNLDNKEIFEKIQQYAPTEDIKNNLAKISRQQNRTKNIALAKFFISTGLTIATYIGLTKAKHHYTEQKIRKNILKEEDKRKKAEENKQKNPAFKGIGTFVRNFAYSPVKNMWILDGAITTERLADSRSPQEFAGYAIKEASLLLMLYYVGGKIQEFCEKHAHKKYNKSIGLDARVLESKTLQKAFEDGSIMQSLEEFAKVKEKGDAAIYEFLHKHPDNYIVKYAKKSDIIQMYKKPNKWYEIFKKPEVTDKIDTRKFIDLEDIKGVDNKLSTLYKQYKEAISKGETSEKFFKGVKKLKRGSIIMNIGTSMVVLGLLTPAIMVAKRLADKNDIEFHTKKQIREQMREEGLIA